MYLYLHIYFPIIYLLYIFNMFGHNENGTFRYAARNNKDNLKLATNEFKNMLRIK